MRRSSRSAMTGPPKVTAVRPTARSATSAGRRALRSRVAPIDDADAHRWSWSTAGAGRSRRPGSQSGFTELLADAGRTGHRRRPARPRRRRPSRTTRPTYADLTARIVDALPDEPVDAVGFSLGAITLLRLATRAARAVPPPRAGGHRPQRVRARRRAGASGSSPASRARPTRTTTWPACSASTPTSPATTAVALAAVMQRPDEGPFTAEELAVVTCPVLVVIGDHDFAGPADAARRGAARRHAA